MLSDFFLKPFSKNVFQRGLNQTDSQQCQQSGQSNFNCLVSSFCFFSSNHQRLVNSEQKNFNKKFFFDVLWNTLYKAKFRSSPLSNSGKRTLCKQQILYRIRGYTGQ